MVWTASHSKAALGTRTFSTNTKRCGEIGFPLKSGALGCRLLGAKPLAAIRQGMTERGSAGRVRWQDQRIHLKRDESQLPRIVEQMGHGVHALAQIRIGDKHRVPALAKARCVLVYGYRWCGHLKHRPAPCSHSVTGPAAGIELGMTKFLYPRERERALPVPVFVVHEFRGPVKLRGVGGL